jgi:hypothetical protein
MNPRNNAMGIKRTICLTIVATGLLCAPGFAQAPTPPARHAPLEKTIGETGPRVTRSRRRL